MGLHNGPSSLGRPHRRAKAQLPPPAGPCPICGELMLPDDEVEADHEIPRVFGGGDGPLRWAHASCNRRAGARLGNRLHGRHRDVPPERWTDRWA